MAIVFRVSFSSRTFKRIMLILTNSCNCLLDIHPQTPSYGLLTIWPSDQSFSHIHGFMTIC